MHEKPNSPKATRFDRETWLRAALDAVAKESGGKLRIDALAKSLNVTKGSFYHHFKDRQDFVDQIVDFWVYRFNHYVVERMQHYDGSPEDQLLTLMKLVKAEGLDLYDITFRAWAAQDSRIAEKVREVDCLRYRFIREIFSKMGFEGSELEMRTRIWIIVATANSFVTFPDDETDHAKDCTFLTSHEFFTRRGD